MWACEELAKRYIGIGELVDDDLIEECRECIYSTDADAYQKRAANIILKLKYGARKANDIVEEKAVVINRNNPLVARWAKKVKERDGKCIKCGSKENLCAHHISHWADDPINRINIDNGITLCATCHRSQHPDLPKQLFGGG